MTASNRVCSSSHARKCACPALDSAPSGSTSTSTPPSRVAASACSTNNNSEGMRWRTLPPRFASTNCRICAPLISRPNGGTTTTPSNGSEKRACRKSENTSWISGNSRPSSESRTRSSLGSTTDPRAPSRTPISAPAPPETNSRRSPSWRTRRSGATTSFRPRNWPLPGRSDETVTTSRASWLGDDGRSRNPASSATAVRRGSSAVALAPPI